jgi:hypothetical protein
MDIDSNIGKLYTHYESAFKISLTVNIEISGGMT